MTNKNITRLDKWLWYARFFKSRSRATQFCNMGKLRVDGKVINKAHLPVRLGMILTFAQNQQIRTVKILDTGIRRGPASEAQTLYYDISAELPTATTNSNPKPSFSRKAGSGRPTKRDRRRLDQLHRS